MLSLGTTDLYIEVASLPRQELEDYSTKLFDRWEEYIQQTLKISDYALALEIEEGSIKARTKIAAAATAIYFGIAQYGSFISGVQTIQGQIKATSEFLIAQATTPFSLGDKKPKVKRTSGSLGELQRLFLKVQQGHISVEQAMHEVEAIFGEELNSAPGFATEIKSSLERIPLLATQMDLPLGFLEQDLVTQFDNKKRRSPPQRPKRDIFIGPHFRVEVWRESQKEKRKVRTTPL